MAMVEDDELALLLAKHERDKSVEMKREGDNVFSVDNE